MYIFMHSYKYGFHYVNSITGKQYIVYGEIYRHKMKANMSDRDWEFLEIEPEIHISEKKDLNGSW